MPSLNVDSIQRLYVAYFNRPADPVGETYWIGKLDAITGGAVATQAQLTAFATTNFSPSAEYTATYAGQTNAQIVDNLYLNLFGRHAEAAGDLYWAGKLTDGSLTFAQLALTLTYSAQGTDATAIANKVTVANLFTTAIDTTAEITGYSGASANNIARNWLSSVTSDAATVTAATASVGSTVSSSVSAGASSSASSFTLTTGADTASATVFSGVISTTAGATSDTLTAADTLTGTGTTPSLNITHTGAANTDALNGALITGIQTVNVRNASTTGVGNLVTLDASKISGLTAVNANLSTGDLAVTNLATGATVGVIGNGTLTNGATSYAYKTVSAARNIAISGGATGTGVISNTDASATTATAATISSTGAANTVGAITLTDNGSRATITSLTVNAAANLTATLTAADFAATSALTVSGAATSVSLANATNFATIDASGLTAGGLTATLGTGVTSFKGGAGNDVVTTATLTATVAGEVDGGAGTNTLVVAAAANINSATTGAEFTHFQILKHGIATALDISNVAGITSEILTASGAGLINLNATQAGAVTLQATDNAFTLALADYSGSSDVVSLTLQNATPALAATVISATAQTITGFETENVAVNSGIATALTSSAATGADQITFAAAANLKSLVVTGAYDIGIDVSANATALTKIDVSGLTGTAGAGITLGLQTGALVVTGSANADFITLGTPGGAGTQTINAGGGDDTVTGTQAQVAAATIDGGTGVNTLSLTDPATTINDATFLNVSHIQKVALGNTTTLTWNVGGYANAIATGNGGVLDVTIASLAPTSATLLNASTLSGTNSLKLNLTTDGVAVGGNTVTITGSAKGADAITLSTVASATDKITLNETGTGNVSIDYSGFLLGGAASTLTINLGSGTATVTGGVGPVATAGSTQIVTGTGLANITLAAAHSSTGLDVSTAAHSTTTVIDTVKNFTMTAGVGTTDYLHFADTTVLVTANLNTNGNSGWTVTAGIATKSGATVADFIAAIASETGAVAAAAFSDGVNTWVGHGDGAAATTSSDHMVELVGLHTATVLVNGVFSATTIALF